MDMKIFAVSAVLLVTVGIYSFGYNIGSQLCEKGAYSYRFNYSRAWDEKGGTMYNLPILGSIYVMGLRTSTSDCRETETRRGAKLPFD